MSCERLPVEPDGAGIRTHHPEEDFHESALARPIFAKQPDDLCARYGKIDIFVCAYGAVPLADAFHCEHRQSTGRKLTAAKGHRPPRASSFVTLTFNSPEANFFFTSCIASTTSAGTAGFNSFSLSY